MQPQLPLQELLGLLLLRSQVQLREGLDGVDLLRDGLVLQEPFLVLALQETGSLLGEDFGQGVGRDCAILPQGLPCPALDHE